MQLMAVPITVDERHFVFIGHAVPRVLAPWGKK